MSKPRRAVPDFADEAEERLFWETHDTADHVDWSTARPVRLPNLREPTVRDLRRADAAVVSGHASTTEGDAFVDAALADLEDWRA